MKELAERLKGDLEWLNGFNYPEQYESSVKLSRPELDTILSALQTVAGIERLMPGSPWFGKMLSGDIEIRFAVKGDVIECYGPDLPSAVSAAVEQLEKGIER